MSLSLEAPAWLWVPVVLFATLALMPPYLATLMHYPVVTIGMVLAPRGLGFATADRGAVEDYLVHCDAQGLSKATRARRLSAIRQLFRFAHDEGWRADNPAIRITGPGASKRLPKTLSTAEVERLLDAARTKGRSPGERLRNRALMELLYATGMRVSELVGLPVAAARGDPRMVLVRGKGGKERMVPLSGPALATLAQVGRFGETNLLMK